jgi:hypothetical protein
MKAVHLQVVSDLITEAFINSLSKQNTDGINDNIGNYFSSDGIN